MAAHRLIAENNNALKQAVALLEQITDQQYCHCEPAYFSSCLGRHIRHCVDHYSMFLDGLATGKINYDERPRDDRIETDRQAAVRKLQQLSEALQRIPENALAASVSINSNEGEPGNSSSNWSASTVARELQFLLSHTVHHLALVAVIVRLQGGAVPPDFGFAQSTIKHERSQSTCAQ